MSDNRPLPAARTAEPHHRLRVAALTAVILGVLLLAAAAFVLSYSGIHEIALQAGVAPKLARIYPAIFDAMLVIAGAAALTMRGAGWWMRLYVWLSLLILLAAVAAGDALHAMSVPLPRQPARAVVAVTPWALLLLGFGYWLAMLRQLRRGRSNSSARPHTEPSGAAVSWTDRGEAPDQPARTGLDLLLEPRTGQPPEMTRPDEPSTVRIVPPAEGGYLREPFIIHESASSPGAGPAIPEHSSGRYETAAHGASRYPDDSPMPGYSSSYPPAEEAGLAGPDAGSDDWLWDAAETDAGAQAASTGPEAASPDLPDLGHPDNAAPAGTGGGDTSVADVNAGTGDASGADRATRADDASGAGEASPAAQQARTAVGQDLAPPAEAPGDDERAGAAAFDRLRSTPTPPRPSPPQE